MPSTQFFVQSGGIPLVSGNPYSGTPWPVGGVQVKVSKEVSGLLYVGWSGTPTFTSGGSLSSGGMADAWPLANGEEIYIQRAVLYNLSGNRCVDAVRLVGPTGASGLVVNWFVD